MLSTHWMLRYSHA